MGPRRTDSPHPCRGGKFSKSKPGIPRSRGLCCGPRLPRPESSAAVRGPGPRSVVGRRSSVPRVSKPRAWGRGPATDRLPASVRRSPSIRKIYQVQLPAKPPDGSSPWFTPIRRGLETEMLLLGPSCEKTGRGKLAKIALRTRGTSPVFHPEPQLSGSKGENSTF